MGADRVGFQANYGAKAHATCGETPEAPVGGIRSDKLQPSATPGTFALIAELLGSENRRFPSAFTYWYGLALALITVCLLGVMMGPAHGSPLSWMGRAAHFLGGTYMLVLAIASLRDSHAWEMPPEEKLRREPAFVSEVLKTVGALVAVLDREGRIVSFNRACEEATGYSMAEVKGKCVWDFLLVPDEVEPVKAVFEQLRAGQFPNAHEHYWLAKDGTRRLIHWHNIASWSRRPTVSSCDGTCTARSGLSTSEARACWAMIRMNCSAGMC
jgi:PAS domain S-box-containing protein